VGGQSSWVLNFEDVKGKTKRSKVLPETEVRNLIGWTNFLYFLSFEERSPRVPASTQGPSGKSDKKVQILPKRNCKPYLKISMQDEKLTICEHEMRLVGEAGALLNSLRARFP
jgi:hypothetical protein